MSFDERGLFQLDYEGMIDRGALASDTTTDNERNEVVASTLELHAKQALFMDAVSSGKYNYLGYGGAIQGGKTTVALTTLFLLAKIYPGSRWAITRKDLATLKRNTLPSFNRIRPVGFASEMSRSEWVCRCANGSEIFFFAESLDQDPDYDRWKGLLVNGFVFEEMNELAETTFFKAMERAGTWKVRGEQPPPLIIGTCNPAKNWVMHRFYAPWKDGKLEAPYFFLPANSDDNPHLSPGYIESLKNLPPNEYKRFVKGDWDVLDDPDQLIKFEWLVNAKANVEPIDGPQRLGVDVARYGDDYSSMAKRQGNTLKSLERWHGFSTTASGEKVGKVIALEKIEPGKVFVDVVGLGAGTVDWLHGNGFKVKGENGGSSALGNSGGFFKFKNRRSQMWWNLREALRLGQISIDDSVDTRRLFEDLTVPKYTISNDKTITVESKDSLKKRLNRSPDEGDAVVLAWADIGNERKMLSFGDDALKTASDELSDY